MSIESSNWLQRLRQMTDNVLHTKFMWRFNLMTKFFLNQFHLTNRTLNIFNWNPESSKRVWEQMQSTIKHDKHECRFKQCLPLKNLFKWSFKCIEKDKNVEIPRGYWWWLRETFTTSETNVELVDTLYSEVYEFLNLEKKWSPRLNFKHEDELKCRWNECEMLFFFWLYLWYRFELFYYQVKLFLIFMIFQLNQQ